MSNGSTPNFDLFFKSLEAAKLYRNRTFTTGSDKKTKGASSPSAKPNSRLNSAAPVIADLEKSFLKHFAKTPYDYQKEVITKVFNNESVFVDVPTGGGKTVAAKAAIFKNLNYQAPGKPNRKKTIYTVPTKALANDKFEEFKKELGLSKVGILTGDRSERRDANVLIVTTEVYNLLLQDKAFMKNVASLIYDEAHYIGDDTRGGAWEQSMIRTPESIQTILLTASMGNTEQFVRWFNSLRSNPADEMSIVKSRERVVDLEQKVEVISARNGRKKTQLKLEFVNEIAKKKQLPAIYVAFSRSYCDSLARQYQSLIAEGKAIELLSSEQKSKLNATIDSVLEKNPELKIFKHDIELLRLGIGVHHAGKVPTLKLLIEKLMDENLLPLVFATETLAVGINKPVQTVIIDGMHKNAGSQVDGKERFNETILDPRVYTQITGRAGRPGFHDKGFVYMLANNNDEKGFIEKTYFENPLPNHSLSSFKLDYSFLLGLLKNQTPDEIKEMMKSSYARFLDQEAQELVSSLEAGIEGLKSESDQQFYHLVKKLGKSRLAHLKRKLSSYTIKEGRLTAMVKLLKEGGFIQEGEADRYQLTPKGKLASCIHMNNPLFLAELLSDDELFVNLSAEEFVAFIACFAHFNRVSDFNPGNSNNLLQVLRDQDKQSLSSQVIKKVKAFTKLKKANKGAASKPILFDAKSYKKILAWAQLKDPDTNFSEFLSRYNLEQKANIFIRQIATIKELLNSISYCKESLGPNVRDRLLPALETIDKGSFVTKHALVD